METDVASTVRTVALTAEPSAGRMQDLESTHSGVKQWLEERQLIPARRGALYNLGKRDEFDSLREKKGAVYWPPVNGVEALVPIVFVTRTQAGFAIRVALLRMDDEISALGFRIDEPHEGGRHDFHHAQLFMHAIKGDSATRLGDPDAWLPERQPSFPIQASNPLEMLWATSVAIYGRRGEALSPFEGVDHAQRSLREYLAKLNGETSTP